MRTNLVKLALVYAAVISMPAMAYIDPGSGHLMIQMILGFAVGGLFLLKNLVGSIRAAAKSVRSRIWNSREKNAV